VRICGGRGVRFPPATRRDPVVARWSLMMPRPGWFAGWQIDGWSGREGNAEAVIP
jgi:hypothetical protein